MFQRKRIELMAQKIRDKEMTTDELVDHLKELANDTPNDSTLGFFIRTLMHAI